MSVRLACYVFVLGCTFVCAVLQHTQGFCEQNWIQYEDNCYLAEFINKKTWPEAQNTCRQMNMDLVSIHSERENSFIYNIIKNKLQDMWIGLKRQSGGTLNGFGWTDNSLANFAKWRFGEPNNRLQKENCGEMHFWNGQWNDCYCAIEPTDNSEIKKGFICKAKAYGIFRAYISGPPFINKTQLGSELQISCFTDDVYPSTTYSWTVTSTSFLTTSRCSSGRICTLRPRLQDDGSTVICIATNEREVNRKAVQTYKINVAYGPFSANISGPTFINKTQLGMELLLSCSTDDVYPSATYSWTVSGTSSLTTSQCSSGRTCSLRPRLQDHGMTVTCTATNELDVSRNAVGTYQINVACSTVLRNKYGYCKQSNWIQNEDNCYFTEFTNRKTWAETFNTCRQMNMDLVSIHSDREQNFIFSMIKGKSQDVWIGLKRQPGGTLNGFAWTDGSLTNFTNWDSGEPNHANGEEDCAEMYSRNGKWNDNTCDSNSEREREAKKNCICKAQTLPSGPTCSNLIGPSYSSHNQVIHLSCCTDGAYPGIDYQWDGVTCHAKTVTAQCGTCTMTSAKEQEGKTITCITTNTRDRSIRTSASYTIAIAYGPSNASIFEPLLKHLRPNLSVNLSCIAYDAFPGVTFTWSGKTCVKNEPLTDGSTCSFTPLSSDDGRTVSCTARNVRDISLSRTVQYKISIADGPSNVSIIEPLIKHLRPNLSVNLSCIAYDAFPGVTFTWSGITCVKSEPLTDGSTCSFTPLSSDDGGTVTCTARNVRDISLSRTVQYKISIADGPSNASIIAPFPTLLKPNQTVNLSCIAYDAFPGVNYTWSGITCVQRHIFRDGSTCSFTPSSHDDGKAVTCTATNVRDTNLSRTAIYNIRIAGDVWTNYLPIIIGSMGGVIVLILAIIIAVLWKRKHRGLDNNTTYVPEPGDQGVGELDVHCSEMKTENNFYDVIDSSGIVMEWRNAPYAQMNTVEIEGMTEDIKMEPVYVNM